MADFEKYGRRDLHYSQWHRTLGHDYAQIDVDWCEYCRECKDVLCIVETARYVRPSQSKNTEITERMAELMNRPAYLVFYALDGKQTGIEYFVVQRLRPNRTRQKCLAPEEWGRYVRRLHKNCAGCKARRDGVSAGESASIGAFSDLAAGKDIDDAARDPADVPAEVDECDGLADEVCVGWRDTGQGFIEL